MHSMLQKVVSAMENRGLLGTSSKYSEHQIMHYSMFFGATVLGEVLNICPYSSLGMNIEY